jgi:hypothetical protein
MRASLGRCLSWELCGIVAVVIVHDQTADDVTDNAAHLAVLREPALVSVTRDSPTPVATE